MTSLPTLGIVLFLMSSPFDITKLQQQKNCLDVLSTGSFPFPISMDTHIHKRYATDGASYMLRNCRWTEDRTDKTEYLPQGLEKWLICNTEESTKVERFKYLGSIMKKDDKLQIQGTITDGGKTILEC